MSDEIQFKKLLEPIKIAGMTLRNRIVMAPIRPCFANNEGYPTERTMGYYGARAAGGTGMIIVGSLCVDGRVARNSKYQLLIDNDKFISDLAKLCEAIQKHGAKACAQIHHFGPKARYDITNIRPVAASPVESGRFNQQAPRALDPSEIEEIIAQHIEAAIRAKKAGFDAIEITMSGGYLLGSFLSRIFNKRQDAYGGDLESRARICLEIVKGARKKLGTDYPILCKVPSRELGEEYGIEGCLTIEEGKQFTKMLENASVNGITTHVAGYFKTATGVADNTYMKYAADQGMFIPIAAEIKKNVTMAVMTTGRLTPYLAEQALRENKIDLAGIARGLIADPEFANKVASGKVEDITPCIVCFRCGRAADPLELTCTVNPAVGKESEYVIKPAAKSKKVLIIGGGAAGMEAARVAALRRHKVVLYEKEATLGGQLIIAAIPPRKAPIADLLKYFTTQLNKLGVKVELGKEATSAIIEQIKPDVVVVATGGIPLTPQIKNLDRDNVIRAEDVLLDKVQVKNRIAVIGGAAVGCETAEFLADKGKNVTIVEMLDELASGMPAMRKKQLLDRLVEKRVILLTNAKCEEITERGIIITKDFVRKTIEVDNIILAAGARPNNQFFKALEGKVPEIYAIGDCVKPDDLLKAIDDGSRVGRLI